jgi:glutamate synthase (NADPH/NADH) small chain
VSIDVDFVKMEKGFDWGQAVAEANRCLLCHDAPCSKGCPAETDPGLFIRKLRLKNLTGAVRTIKKNNILGGACGVLCPVHRLCEKECCATGIGRPIAIGKIQRFLIEYSWRQNLKVLPRPRISKEKVAVVGSGPAGLSCAAQLARLGYDVTVFEALPEPGGVIRYGVVAYRFDQTFLAHELEDIKALGVKIVCNAPINEKKNVQRLLDEGFGAVFLGTGLWDAVRLEAKRARVEGLHTSINYLKALRDTRFEAMAKRIRGRIVAVIGGGSVAIDCVESAAKLGAKDVYLIYRRSYAQMPAEPDERVGALNAGVHFLVLNQPVDYMVDPSGKIEGIKLIRTQLGQPDKSGRRRPQSIPDSEWILKADMVVEAIGNKAPADAVNGYPNVQVDDRGLITVNQQTGQTSAAGIFAGGDNVRGPALVVNAVADGKTAARAIDEFLTERRG